MTTTDPTTPTPVERAAEAIHADCGPDYIAEYDDLEPESQAQWRGYAEHALTAALDVDEIARVLSRATWPDGSHDGFPTKRVADMLAAALIEHLTRTETAR
ncbi:hypothetical protein Xcel_0559 [Xylanimonas cellulosilytica DSM 15894]|uniref:Uncharacterized protein n=1 Tax=Xylanimonas cellulosilytica (strain DSM 15894 / JCM 12276 / CECT 5975 / KCTC 9989 / LMG 20990 / NBRC 107835 / XIL07) TaxID=446471 RepID=D1BWL6_XYLCX|nr:hypothetical protein [Xylanimonas cellulosilytica]ACZ29598.1 hypothetical protein Xcel_0559 [Xylanimonas cellulosilytica DSM 15894]